MYFRLEQQIREIHETFSCKINLLYGIASVKSLEKLRYASYFRPRFQLVCNTRVVLWCPPSLHCLSESYSKPVLQVPWCSVPKHCPSAADYCNLSDQVSGTHTHTRTCTHTHTRTHTHTHTKLTTTLPYSAVYNNTT